MGSCITAGACCCVGCCCQQCADGLTKWLGMERVTKIFYLILVIVFTVPAIFVFFFLNKWSDFTQYFDDMINCPTTNEYIWFLTQFRLHRPISSFPFVTRIVNSFRFNVFVHAFKKPTIYGNKLRMFSIQIFTYCWTCYRVPLGPWWNL